MARASSVESSRAGMSRQIRHVRGNTRRVATGPPSSGIATVNAPYSAAATLSACPSTSLAIRSSVRRSKGSPSSAFAATAPPTIAAALEPRPRAIVSRPQLILLDEPVSGVAVEEAHRLRELLLAINRELGIAMVVIEHNIGFLVSLCHSISVMSEGRIIAEGDAAAVVRDPRVRLAYFGEQEAAA